MASRRKNRQSGDPPGGPRGATAVSKPPAAATSWRIALIVLAGIVSYANSLAGPFVLDDQDTIVMNEQIRDLSPAVVLRPAVELPVAGRPVVNVSFALNYAFGGLDVRGYHIVNIALHVVCALLLFGIVRRTLPLPSLGERFGTRAPDLAFATAIIWLVHPLQTDAVDYVTQRTELIMGLFYLLTLYASIRALRETRWGVVAVAACALGMGSKESMVTAPFIVVAYDRVFVFGSLREAWDRRSRLYMCLGATWLLLAALVSAGPRFRSAGFSAGVSVWTYLLNQTEMIVRYLRLSVWPSGLVVDYGAPRAVALGDVAGYAVAVLGLVALTVWALVRRPALGFLGLWFFTTLSPTSSFIPIATEVGAERRMYLPLAAVVMLGVVGGARLLERWAQKSSVPDRAHAVGMAVLTVVAALLGTATVVRNTEYASPVSLARVTFERWPNARTQHSLGVALVGDKQYEAGIRELRAASEVEPAAHYTLGVALFQQGKLDEAVVHLREFLARESLRIEVPSAHELIGRALRAQGRLPEAAAEFEQVLRMTPSNIEVQRLLAEALLRQNKFDEAAARYQQYLASRPSDAGALMQLGIAYVASNRTDDAIAQFRRVVELVPRDGMAHRNLARALLSKGAYDEAATHARQATLLLPDDPVAHDQLGVALAGQGNLDEAITELQRAVQLDPSDSEARAHLAVALQAKQTPGSAP